MKTRLLFLATTFALATPLMAQAQLPIKIPGVDLKLPGSKPTPKPTQRPKPKMSSYSAEPEKKAAQNTNLLARVKQEQAGYANNNMLILDNSGSQSKQIQGPRAYLRFSKDYAGKETQHVFTGKDFIYAHLQLDKPLTTLLPTKKDGEPYAKVQYYRVNLKTKVNGYRAENNIKIQKGAPFQLAYDNPNLTLAVVPEKGFFEHILDEYRSEGKFANATTEAKALSDLTARNFSRQMAHLYQRLPVGEHKVDMEFEVTAKLKGSNYVGLRNMKGTFLLQVDQEAKERYGNTVSMLSNLYKSYDKAYGIARMSIGEEQEKEMLSKMSPRERERFLTAKRSPLGYLAAYNGPKVPLRFVFGKLRNKNAYVDIVWPAGSCSKCEAGTSSVMVSKRTPRTVQVPPGAKISINGRTLVSGVKGAKTVPLYWFY